MDPLVRKFSRLYELSEEEKQLLRRLHSKTKNIEAGSIIATAGEEAKSAYLLLDGWSMVYKNLPEGEQQVVNFAIPGDFLGLFSIMLKRVEYTVETITDAMMCEIHWDHLVEIFTGYPRLAMAVCWYGARDQAMLRETLARIGRHSAFNRIGHILLELCYRLDEVNMVSDGQYIFPIKQEMLANALGLTPVHVSRTLKKLRDSGLVTLENNLVKLTDTAELAKQTEFDRSYLESAAFPAEISEQKSTS